MMTIDTTIDHTPARRSHDHDVLLLTQDDVSGAERVGSGSMVDGIVVMDVEAHDERLPSLSRLRQPAVLIGLPAEPGTLSCVDLDFESAGRIALEQDKDAARATGLFRAYLDEAPKGALAEDAWARLIESQVRSGQGERAREAANHYLDVFPQGRYARLARDLLAK